MKVELCRLPDRLRLPLVDMLQSMVGREVSGRALQSGIPGQVVKLQLGSQTLKALLQARGVQEGQMLHFRVEKESGQFFLRLIQGTESDVAMQNRALREFVLSLASGKLQFFQSAVELLRYWKNARKEEPEPSGTAQRLPADTQSGTTGPLATEAVDPQAKDQPDQEESAALSLENGPFFLAMTHCLPAREPALFVFYSSQKDFQSVRLLIVQPNESERRQLERSVQDFRDDSLVEITVLDRFPDPSFFGAGQLWQA